MFKINRIAEKAMATLFDKPKLQTKDTEAISSYIVRKNKGSMIMTLQIHNENGGN